VTKQPASFLGTPATAPGPLGPSMLRSFGVIRSNPLAYLAMTWREFGDIVQFPIPRPPSYLINDPVAVRQVLVDNARNYGKATLQYKALSLVTGEGLLTADGGAWRRQRRLVQPAFHHSSIAGVATHVNEAAERLVGRWRAADDVVDADEGLMHAALEIVGHALFGSDLSGDADRIAQATLEALDVVIARARVPISPPSWMPTPANRQLARANAVLDDAVSSMVVARRSSGVGDGSPDMLDLLLATRDEDGDHLTAAEIRDQIVTFIVAGHETVASALSWAFALLADRPEWQERIAEEATTVGVDAGAYPTLHATRAVIDEVLRLMPPAWLITRQAHAPDVLAGHEIPKGALLILSPALLHRHPSRWKNPDDFAPERFLDGSVDRQAFIPFGAGPRLCIGRDFAYMEAVLLLAHITRDLCWQRPQGLDEPVPEPLVTIRPRNGVPLIFSSR
jgi:cytochrome P450